MNSTKQARFIVIMAVALAVAVTILTGLGPAQANQRSAAIPAKVLTARTIYVDNQTNDVEFQSEAFLALSKWGRFQIADSPQKADLILRLSGSSMVKFVPGSGASSTYDPKPVSQTSADGEGLAPAGCTRITLIEPKSGNLLWSELRKMSNAQEKSRLLDGLHDAVDQQEKKHGK